MMTYKNSLHYCLCKEKRKKTQHIIRNRSWSSPFVRKAFLTKMGVKWQHILQHAPGCPFVKSCPLCDGLCTSGMPQHAQLPPLLYVNRIRVAGGQAPTVAPGESGAVIVTVFTFFLVLVFPGFQHLQLPLLFSHEDLDHENLLFMNLLTNVLGNVWDNPVNKVTHKHDQVLENYHKC